MSALTESMQKCIDENEIKLVSFDIFDTLVFRKVSKPIDIFTTMFNEFNSDEIAVSNAYEFREIRQFAEKLAKANTQTKEVSLTQIYDCLPFAQNVKNCLLKHELAVESRNSFLHQELIEFIQELNVQGVKVVLISDMYLSESQIRSTFLHENLTLSNLPIYTSSEFQQNKHSGGIFKILSGLLSVEFNTWMHVGDNLQADFNSPNILGIHGKHLAPITDFNRICEMEYKVFEAETEFNAVRHLAAIQRPTDTDAMSFEIGSVVWGPILLGFADWVIDEALAVKSKTILSLMREAETYVPIIEQRLRQRNISHISVKKLYASRKSTFWPSIDTQSSNWFEKLVNIFSMRRGYTVADFYRDFYIQNDELLNEKGNQLMQKAGNIYCGSDNLLNLVVEKAKQTQSKVKEYITQQKALFLAYYKNHIDLDFSGCCVLDLGNGGTIQNQLESIFGQKSSANLLFYSSSRIYRSIQQTSYKSYIHAGNDQSNIRQLLTRSPECIEVFLVGNCGTTLGYSCDGNPIVADTIRENSNLTIGFLKGAQRYIDLHHQLGFGSINSKQSIALLNRYVQLPTSLEAELFTRIFHQDNFGSDQIYPVICENQIEKVKSIGIEPYYLNFREYSKLNIREVHWPQAVISLIDKNFLFKQTGYLSMDTNKNVTLLLNLILEKGWKRFSVYGAGEFFETLAPQLTNHNIQIDYLVDRKAEIVGRYKVLDFDVFSLNQALSMGCDRVVISSLAYKDEIIKNIFEQSVVNDLEPAEMLHL